MERKNGCLVLSEGEQLDFFQGVFITTIPKEESKTGKECLIIEEHTSLFEREQSSASWTDEIPIPENITPNSFKQKIYQVLTDKHFETVRMGFPEVLIDRSVLELF